MTTSLTWIEPVSIVESMLSTYNVAEPDSGPAAYNGATTYAKDALVYVQAAQKIYQSTHASNTGHDPVTDASETWWAEFGEAAIVALPDAYAALTTYAKDDRVYVSSSGLVYTSVQNANTGHDPVADTTHVWWAIAGAVTGAAFDPPAYSAVTTYAMDARVHIAATHTTYVSVQDGNIAHEPTLDLTNTWWVAAVKTNRHKMFDQRNSSQTMRIGGIDQTITTGKAANGLALLNCSLVSAVQVTVTDPVAGQVYDKTTDLLQPLSEMSLWSYFFDPISYSDTFVVTDLPAYRNASIRVQAKTSSVTDVAGVGECIVGPVKTIGFVVRSGAKVGIKDFSLKGRDAYGNYNIVERDYSRYAKFEINLHRNQVDAAINELALRRAKPTLFIGDNYYKSTVVFGTFTDAEISIDFWDLSVLPITIEGFT